MKLSYSIWSYPALANHVAYYAFLNDVRYALPEMGEINGLSYLKATAFGFNFWSFAGTLVLVLRRQ